MSNSTTSADISERVIRFLKQQRELYGDFSIELSEQETVEPTISPNTPLSDANEFEVVGKESDEVPSIDNDNVTAAAEYEDAVETMTIEQQIEACLDLESLNSLYSEHIDRNGEVVFGVGISSPKVMIIGGAPGKHDFNNKSPFSANVGEILDKILSALQLSRSHLYLTNLLKYRPSKEDLSKAEIIKLNTQFTLKEIALVQPKIVLCVGELVAQTLIDSESEFDALRGRIITINNQDFIATYHPAQLLLDETLKRPCWEDLKNLKAYLSKP